ncbi:hypothetical protein CH367_19485 [Leptospira barantonii]|uniref:Uncharacterized protein n=1 Tax=Leptospira barantonii TaxID=2023184 RepID=A0ABX4NG37_9LEPT|nr:hypothetical protein CH367_19485 [Leptospira barantonii]
MGNLRTIPFITKNTYSQSQNDNPVGTFSEIGKPIYNFATDFFDLKRANDCVRRFGVNSRPSKSFFFQFKRSRSTCLT